MNNRQFFELLQQAKNEQQIWRLASSLWDKFEHSDGLFPFFSNFKNNFPFF